MKKDQANNEEPLKQELSAAADDKDDSEGQDLMTMAPDDADLAEDDDENFMEQGDDENSEVQSDPTAQRIIIYIYINILKFKYYF